MVLLHLPLFTIGDIVRGLCGVVVINTTVCYILSGVEVNGHGERCVYHQFNSAVGLQLQYPQCAVEYIQTLKGIQKKGSINYMIVYL